MSATLVVSLHDVAPATARQTEGWLAALDRRGIPVSLLVIPGEWRGRSLCSDAGFVRFVADRAAAGDEIVQHGWRHAAGVDGHGWRSLAQRAVCRGAGEFAAVSEQSALLRLRAGRGAMRQAGLEAAGFTAPGWLHSPGTVKALVSMGFRYTTTHFGVLDLRRGTSIGGLALSNRPGSAAAGIASQLMLRTSRLVSRTGGLVRIALHPDDLDHPGLADSTLTAIDRCLAAGARAVTYGDLLARAAAGSEPAAA